MLTPCSRIVTAESQCKVRFNCRPRRKTILSPSLSPLLRCPLLLPILFTRTHLSCRDTVNIPDSAAGLLATTEIEFGAFVEHKRLDVARPPCRFTITPITETRLRIYAWKCGISRSFDICRKTLSFAIELFHLSWPSLRHLVRPSRNFYLESTVRYLASILDRTRLWAAAVSKRSKLSENAKQQS